MSAGANRCSRVYWLIVGISLFWGLGLVLRTLASNHPFQTGDNAWMAWLILSKPGYWWIIQHRYGPLIFVIDKLFVATASQAGILITEFWWKVPIALVGAAQVPLSYLFVKRLGARPAVALGTAAFMSILPVHIYTSRYLWGYDVIGFFCLTLALLGLFHFAERPTVLRGLIASSGCALYLIAHAYIIPFAPTLLIFLLLFSPGDGDLPTRLRAGARAFVTKGVWVIPVLLPLLVGPVYYTPLRHTFQKDTQLGFYLFDHLSGFIEDTGVVLGASLVAAVCAAVVVKDLRTRPAVFLALAGGAYLAPLIFGAPPGTTVVKGYLLMGICLWVHAAAFVADQFVARHARVVLGVAAGCFLLTLWGSVETVFGRDQWVDPSLVKGNYFWGQVPPDPGAKTAGYFVRKYVPTSASILALHYAVEPPNLWYYFDRTDYAFEDLILPGTLAKFHEYKDVADVVICAEDQLPTIEADGRFQKKLVIFSEGAPRMWLYAKPSIDFPKSAVNAEQYNTAYDREFTRPVNFW